MYRDYNIIVVTPAGRRCYLEMLIPQIRSFSEVVDEYHIWLNTKCKEDIEYIEDIESDFIKVKHLPTNSQCDGIFSIHHFYKECTDKSTIYVRFDDDIILVDSLEAFKKFLDFRIDNPEYFLIFANIINNACMTHVHQRLGYLTGEICNYNVTDDIGWKSGSSAVCLHHQVLNKLEGENDLAKFRFDGRWILMYKEEFSINCVSWFGKGFNGVVGRVEEPFLTKEYTRLHNTTNCVYGGFCVVHYAFHTQRNTVDQFDILSKYKSVIKRRELT